MIGTRSTLIVGIFALLYRALRRSTYRATYRGTSPPLNPSPLPPITRVLDLREAIGHPPSVALAVKAARYCKEVRVGHEQHELRAGACSMWTENPNKEGPWYMRHAKEEAVSGVDFKSMAESIRR